MGGHSHWAGIKHKKALVDAKRGKVWTKIVREITIAAKMGGGDINGNPRLRKAVDDARAANMPSDNIKKAIQRGTGELPGVIYEELLFEGYATGGVAVLVEASTDNRNRTTSEVRFIFAENGGNLGSAGCVGWMFKPKGVLRVPRAAVPDEEGLLALCLEVGAEDIKTEEGVYEIYTAPNDFDKVRQALTGRKVAVESSELSYIPDNLVPVKEADAPRVLKLVEALEEHDDVKAVHSNFDIPESVLAKFSA